MPSISAQHTPLESFLFLDWIGRNGIETPVFLSASQSLRTNAFVLSDKSYDADRLAPQALRTLYEQLTEHGVNASLTKDGISSEQIVNPRKRKLSPSPDRAEGADPKTAGLSGLVERLYTFYRDRAIRDLRQQEQQYHALVAEIRQLEEVADTLQKERVTENVQNGAPLANGLASSRTSHVVPSPVDENIAVGQETEGEALSAEKARSDEQLAHPVEEKTPIPPLQTHTSQSPPHRHLGQSPSEKPDVSASSQRPAHHDASSLRKIGTSNSTLRSPVAVNQQPQPRLETASPRPVNALPPISTLMQPPLPAASNTAVPPPHPPSKKGPGTSPSPPLLPSLASQYPQQAPYGFPYSPQWPSYHPPSSPYPGSQGYHVSTYSRKLPPAQSPRFYPYQHYPYSPSPNSYRTSSYPPATHSPHSCPPSQSPSTSHHPPGQSTLPAAPPPTTVATASVSTPIPAPSIPPPQQPAKAQPPNSPLSGGPGPRGSVPMLASAPSADDPPRNEASATSTPWTPGGKRQDSPERPRQKDVSPLSDQSTPPTPSPVPAPRVRSGSAWDGPRGEIPVEADVQSHSSSSQRSGGAEQSRSSVAHAASRSRSRTSAHSVAIHEGPAGGKERIKSEAPSTPVPSTPDQETRASSRIGDAMTAQSPWVASRQTGQKRKRHLAPDSPSWPAPSSPGPDSADRSVVAVSKNFSRIAAPVLNDVNGHKVAGIFARPLTERDAPGYSDLIYRPQDLKSIRAAVARGSRAANAAIDELEANRHDDGEATPGEKQPPTRPKPSSLPAGSELVPMAEDLRPPKGIVNSAQLEKELMRMFANAVMFNPLPPSERGLRPTVDPQRDRLKHQGPLSWSFSPGARAAAGDSSLKRSGRTRRSGHRHNQDDGKDADGKEHDGGMETATTGAGTGRLVDEEEGGIIRDTRDMFDSVEKAVAEWRGLEQRWHPDEATQHNSATGLRGGNGDGIGGRDAVSGECGDASTPSDPVGFDESTPGHGSSASADHTARTRKRRRVMVD